jgi:hypothetical protein
MPILRDWLLTLNVDQVLRGQGADPASIRTRSQQLVEMAERVIREANAFLKPAVAYEEFAVDSLRHEKLLLEGGGVLHGPLVAAQLGPAQTVVLAVCTLGEDLEQRIAAMYRMDPVYAMALDGMGTAALEVLATQVCQFFDEKAIPAGLQTTIPISPGMIGWPIAEGQQEVFALLDTGPIGVTLNAGSLMIPYKSTSMAIGIGANVRADGKPCDFCHMRDTCRFQDHYPAHAHA